MTRPLALFGGTFDPVHLGHMRVAWEAAEQLDAHVNLVPASVPPHRPQPVASAAQRVAMLRAALAGQQRLGLDERELRRSGPSYTIDTLIELRSEIGPARPLVVLIGADAWAGLPSWHRWTELFALAHIGVLTRAGQAADEPAGLAAEADARRTDQRADIANAPFGRVIGLSVSALEISATRIRADLAAGREPRYLIADALLDDPAVLAAYRPRKST